ncbi:MAG TPA: hypothetical protein VFC63_12110 [Blastocatellia bacterium]|nr:hypothetical protein [Blastocatellia bacterium]
MREQTAEKTVTAVPFKGKIFALGTIEDVRACFGNNIKDIPRPTPLPEGSLRFEDGAITCLMREALVHSIVLATGLRSDGSRELWAEDTVHDESLEGELFRIFESVHLTLRQIDGRSFLILKPSIKVLTISGDTVPTLKSNALKLRILGWQHNKEFNQAVNFWRKRLLTTDRSERIYEYPFKSGAPFRFSIRRSPAFAEITSDRGARGINVDTKIRPLLIQKGLQIDEPRLVFCNRSGTGNVKNVHPVRGLLSNRPFDFPLTMRGLSSEIRMGVVCPKAEAKALQSYLMRSEQQIEPNRQELDYLPSYPGFKNAFGLELKIGDQGNAGWVICPEPNGQNDQANALEIGKNINRSIDTLQASFAPNLVLIFFPERWSRFRGYNTDHEHFDVHDFVKASSVQKGIGTQFLDQSTLADGLQCRVWWWLSLAFYVKAMRTPWVLDELDRNTAFVGLGMSYDFSRDKNKHIVLGCSHIYSSRGEGLQYRLSPVENPVFFGKNPFLSRDDARRVGEQVRELFFESRSTLPDRVVVHKRTRFTKDEQQGLREGLSGVSEIDMLEIIIDDALRYVASAADARGLLHEDNYPVQRGSVVRLDDFTALLWVHGATSAIGNRRYYQGKRRIPAPLRIRRHAGQSDVKILAEEILGLSKMNWNTFDLYTKLPTTVQSSNEIARIGSLLTPFHPRGYDFRLFI